MGGLGSGDWYRLDKKTTVEDSLGVAIGDFRGRIVGGAAGTLTWTWASGGKSSAGWFVTWGDSDSSPAPILTLHYCWADREDVRIPIPLQSTPTQFRGRRWWFTCPLVVGGVACNRRVGKLHLPPGAKYFGCRKCHDLTYRSSQEAHQAERTAKFLANEYGYHGDPAQFFASRPE